MADSRAQLHTLVDELPEEELATARRFLEFLAQEPVGPCFANSIRRAISDADSGQTVVCHSYDEMVAKLLDE